MFADVVAPTPKHWPQVVLLDTTTFPAHKLGVEMFTVYFAYGSTSGRAG